MGDTHIVTMKMNGSYKAYTCIYPCFRNCSYISPARKEYNYHASATNASNPNICSSRRRLCMERIVYIPLLRRIGAVEGVAIILV